MEEKTKVKSAPASSVASLVLGCLSFVFAFITGIPAIICGHIALSKIKKEQLAKGKGIAIAGLVIGYLSLLSIPLLALVIPGANAAVDAAKIANCKNTAFNLRTALITFYTDYRRPYPGTENQTSKTDATFMEAILGAETAAASKANPRGIIFFDFNGSLPEGGSVDLLDPWGNHFRVKDKTVWSLGPDGIEGTADDISTK